MNSLPMYIKRLATSSALVFLVACTTQPMTTLKDTEQAWVGAWQCNTQSHMQRLGKKLSASASTIDTFKADKGYVTQGELLFTINSRQYAFTIKGNGTWRVVNAQLIQRVDTLKFVPKNESITAQLLATLLPFQLALDEEKKADIKSFTKKKFEADVTLDHIAEQPKIFVECYRRELT